jgi:hypothetical protein
MSGELLFRREQDALLFATFVQLDNPIARRVWAGLEDRHQQIVHDLLHDATDRLVTDAGGTWHAAG